MRLLKIQLNSAWKEGGTWSAYCIHSLRYHCDVSSKEIPLWHPVLAVSFAPGIRIHMLQFSGCCANARLTSLVSQQHGSWFTASRGLSSIRRATQLRKYSVDLSYQLHLLSPLLLLCYASLQREEGEDFMPCYKTLGQRRSFWRKWSEGCKKGISCGLCWSSHQNSGLCPERRNHCEIKIPTVQSCSLQKFFHFLNL